MGKLIPVVLIMIVTPPVCVAQRVEIGPFAGFQFGGGFTTRDGKHSIPSAASFGVILGFSPGPMVQFEVLYQRQSTDLELEDEATGAATRLFDLTVEHIQVGTLYQYDLPKVKPFVSVMVGATHLAPQGDRADLWWLSGSVGVGAKTMVSRSVGLRAQARFNLSWGRAGDNVFCAPVIVGGCLVGLRGGAVTQTAITGGSFAVF